MSFREKMFYLSCGLSWLCGNIFCMATQTWSPAGMFVGTAFVVLYTQAWSKITLDKFVWDNWRKQQ